MILATSACFGSDSLQWRAKDKQVSADIQTSDLYSLLGKIAAQTGWKVFVEAGASSSVSVKFKDIPQDEALHRMLGKLNYSLFSSNGVECLKVYRTSVKAASQAIAAAKKDYRIHDQDLVKLKRGATNSVDQLAKKVGATVAARDDRIGLYKLQFPDGSSADAALQSLASDPSVAAADGNYSIDRPTPAQITPVASSANSLLNINPQPNPNGPVIGLVDTSVDPPAQFSPYVLTPINVTGQDDPPGADPSHGTSMLETMLEAMSSNPSKILPIDIYGSGESTSTYEMMEGIVSGINAGANPISISSGGTGYSTMLGQLIQEGEQKGITFVAAAGNTPGEGEVYPAFYPGVISVTASTQMLSGPITTSANASGATQLAAYANDPSGTSVIAPGTSLVLWNGQTWEVEGTSPATASTTGTIVDLMNANHWTLSQAVNQVMHVAPAPMAPGGK